MTEQPNASLFGSYGRLDVDPIADALLCHLCGRWFRNLAQHARLAHGTPPDEYRALAGLNRQTRLVSPGMRDRLRAVTAPTIARLRAEGKLRNWREDPERWARDKAAAEAALRAGMRAEHNAHVADALARPQERAARADRRRQRNLAGVDRATPEAIRAGLRRAGPATCRVCGARFDRNSPRHFYCQDCARERQRAQWRAYAAKKRLEKRG